jgi:hypothetical protein
MANMAVNRDSLTAGFARFQPARYLERLPAKDF